MKETAKIDRNNVEDVLSLTPTQEGMLFYYLNVDSTEQYFEQFSMRVSGDIDIHKIRSAWSYVVRNNEVLRALYRWENIDKPVQIILKDKKPLITEYDFSRYGMDEQAKLIEELKGNDRKEKIDISTDPYRILICRISDCEIEMIISYHHILYDGWSNGIILKELFEAYNMLCLGKEAVFPAKNKFREYIKWLNSQDKQQQKDFWVSYLDGLRSKVKLPVDMIRVENRITAANLIKTLPESFTNEIGNLTREHQLTMASFLYSSWGILIREYTGVEDVVFGTTVSGRTPRVKGIENMAGMFINTVPLRIRLNPVDNTLDTLKKVEAGLRERADYETTPLIEVINYSGLNKKQGLFDSIVVIENFPLDSILNSEQSKIKVKDYSMFEMTNYDLNLVITAFNGITLNMVYNSSVYRRETIEEILNHFERALAAVLRDYRESLGQLEILSAAEKEAYSGRIKEPDPEETDSQQTAEEPVAPQNEIEENIAAIWKTILEKEKIGVNDNFFDIGGDSFLLMKMHTRIDKLYPGLITGIQLFSYPTISKISDYLRGKLKPVEQKPLISLMEFPEDYISAHSYGMDDNEFKFIIDKSMANSLRNAAERESVSLTVLLAAPFMYLIHKVTGKDKVEIQTVFDKKDTVVPVVVDFKGLENFSQLFGFIKEKITGYTGTYSIEKLQNNNLDKKKNEILPLFCVNRLISSKTDLPMLYDLIIEIEDAGGEIEFIFKADRLVKEKAVEFAEGYLQTVEQLAAKE